MSRLELISNKWHKTKAELLATLEHLSKRVEAGEITSFACVALSRNNDEEFVYQGGSCHTLTLLGALTKYHQQFLTYNQEVQND